RHGRRRWPAADRRPPRCGRGPGVLAGRGPLVDGAAAAPALLGGGHHLRARRGRVLRSDQREMVAPALNRHGHRPAPAPARRRGAAGWRTAAIAMIGGDQILLDSVRLMSQASSHRDPGRVAIGTWSGGRFMHFGEAVDDHRFLALIAPDERIDTVITADVYG